MKSLKIGRSRKDVKSLKIGRSSLPLAVKEVFSGAQTMVDARCPDIKGHIHNDVVNVVKNQTNILNDTLFTKFMLALVLLQVGSGVYLFKTEKQV